MPRRLFLVFGLLVVVLIIAGGYLYLQDYDLSFELIRRDWQSYQHEETPTFSFAYDANIFEIDTDTESRYGEDYQVGIKLPSDARVGCDVRAIKGSLSLSDDAQKDGARLAKQISQGANFFQSQNYRFSQIGGAKALQMDITVAGPLGETLRMDQAFLERDGYTFNLICGTTSGIYSYFAEEFNRFLASFR